MRALRSRSKEEAICAVHHYSCSVHYSPEAPRSHKVSLKRPIPQAIQRPIPPPPIRLRHLQLNLNLRARPGQPIRHPAAHPHRARRAIRRPECNLILETRNRVLIRRSNLETDRLIQRRSLRRLLAERHVRREIVPKNASRGPRALHPRAEGRAPERLPPVHYLYWCASRVAGGHENVEIACCRMHCSFLGCSSPG
jgi:hypothetical protein